VDCSGDLQRVTTGTNKKKPALMIGRQTIWQSRTRNVSRDAPRSQTAGARIPLRAQDGGCAGRAGHTEAAGDLQEWQGLTPAECVLPAPMHDDGTMARLAFPPAPIVDGIPQEAGLRIAHPKLSRALARSRKTGGAGANVKMPTDYGRFSMHLYRSSLDGSTLAWRSKAQIDKSNDAVRRAQSMPHWRRVQFSRCDCGNQYMQRLRQNIQEEGSGVPVSICARKDAFGDWLQRQKIHAYKWKEEGTRTQSKDFKCQAGYPSDLRVTESVRKSFRSRSESVRV